MLEFIYSSAGSGLSFQANMQIRKTLMSGRGTGAVREEAGIWEIGLLAVTGLVDFLCGPTTKNSGILWLCRVGSCFRLLNIEWMWMERGGFGTLRCDSFGHDEGWFLGMEDFSDFSKKFVKIQRMKFYVLRLPNEVRSERDRQIFLLI
jgi:hypothetical protein